MQTFLITVIVVLIIAAIIRFLHRYQMKEMQESADRSAPLAPLDSEAAPPLADERAGEDGGDGARYWQQGLKALREDGEFHRALALSRAHYPRIQAFQQSLITLRAALRQYPKDEPAYLGLLEELYTTAALADLFRADSALRPDPRRVDIEALAHLAPLKLSLPFDRIGYGRLRLLTKTDIRLLVQAWGEPAAHRHSEEVEAEAWRALLAEAAVHAGP